jgi:hypothetical protein
MQATIHVPGWGLPSERMNIIKLMRDAIMALAPRLVATPSSSGSVVDFVLLTDKVNGMNSQDLLTWWCSALTEETSEMLANGWRGDLVEKTRRIFELRLPDLQERETDDDDC